MTVGAICVNGAGVQHLGYLLDIAPVSARLVAGAYVAVVYRPHTAQILRNDRRRVIPPGCNGAGSVDPYPVGIATRRGMHPTGADVMNGSGIGAD